MDNQGRELVKIIKERIEKVGGSAQVKYLCQSLNSTSSVANNQTELLKFLRKWPDVFQVDPHGTVRIQPSTTHTSHAAETVNEGKKVFSDEKNVLPQVINDGEGIVSKIHPTFGFIKTKNPFKTDIYFTPSNFVGSKKTLLTDFEDLGVGTKLCFIARRDIGEHFSKYKALKVWYPTTKKSDQSKQSDQKKTLPQKKKTQETELYDATFNEGEGNIAKLFPNFGFIAVDKDKDNQVFFYKDRISNFENVTDLTRALKIGDLVEFKAVRAPKNVKARWSATQVCVKRTEKCKANFKPSALEPSNAGKSTGRKFLKGEPGKIFPHSSGVTIKFGKKYEELADADSSLFYLLGAKVYDVSWEYSDGDNVRFDAIEIKSSPGWKATLVWTGDRPNVVQHLDDFSDFLEEDDSVLDSVSCISKSSDNSALSENSNKPLKKARSKSSGFSSSKSSCEDTNYLCRQSSNRMPLEKFCDDSDSCSQASSNVPVTKTIKRSRNPRTQNQAITNANNSSSYQSKKPKSRNSFGKQLKSEKLRFQEHVEFVRSTIGGSASNNADDIQSVCSDSSKKSTASSLNPVSQSNAWSNINWGDSPYPDEECDAQSIPGEGETYFSPTDSEKTDSNSIKYDSEIHSEDEFSDTVGDLDAATSTQSNLTELMGDAPIECSEEQQQPPKNSSIMYFHEMDGIVEKVYCKYAEISNSKLPRSASFFCHDLYKNGISVTENYADLREVIKVGDKLQFNCIHVIDNNGCSFIKFTMVWIGKKPSVVEITPDEYITENNLSVTKSKDDVQYYSEKEDPTSSDKLPSVATVEESVLPVKKFLTLACENNENKISAAQTSVNTDEDNSLFVSASSLKRMATKEDLTESELNLDKNYLVDGISNIIKSSSLLQNPQDDLDSLSSEILDFVLNSCGVKKSPFAQSGMDSPTESHKFSFSENLELENKAKEMTNTESQTIFTGEVIGKSNL